MEARLANLEGAHADLHGEVDTLKGLFHNFQISFGKVEREPYTVDLVKSSQSAKQFKKELEQLSQEVRASINGNTDELESHDNVPPHVRAVGHGASQKPPPPHLRNRKQTDSVHSEGVSPSSVDATKHKHGPLATDGPIDTLVRQPVIPAVALSPPLSPTTTLQCDTPVEGIEALSLTAWKPYHLTTLKTLPADIRAKIPAQQEMTTFTFDLLQNTFDGIAWSPGLRYINSSGACLLANRTYYMLDPAHEPYLPKSPGEHGAKLTAFFNKAPEDEFDTLPEGTNSYTSVPMFVQVSKGRYAYFGNYSQTRWSDKLDNDTMKAHVPQSVKEHIANDLAATPREPWVTHELKKHFFPKPGYEGALPTSANDDTTINTADEEEQGKKVADDVKGYIQELTDWEREANMKTSMIKADFILNAFDAADADDPPALRLWWEYFECVDFKLDFYNMLVGLQARHENRK